MVPACSPGEVLIIGIPDRSSCCENLKPYQQRKPDSEKPPEGFRPVIPRDAGVLKLG
jgi:hypothetical protein